LPKQKHRVVKKMKELKKFAHVTSEVKAADPVWNEIFVINDLPATYSLLRVEVFEKNSVRSDNFLGKVSGIETRSNSRTHTHTHTDRNQVRTLRCTHKKLDSTIG
jgi:Ca2+-dependent lipid-binding protein